MLIRVRCEGSREVLEALCRNLDKSFERHGVRLEPAPCYRGVRAFTGEWIDFHAVALIGYGFAYLNRYRIEFFLWKVPEALWEAISKTPEVGVRIAKVHPEILEADRSFFADNS